MNMEEHNNLKSLPLFIPHIAVDVVLENSKVIMKQLLLELKNSKDRSKELNIKHKNEMEVLELKKVNAKKEKMNNNDGALLYMKIETLENTILQLQRRNDELENELKLNEKVIVKADEELSNKQTQRVNELITSIVNSNNERENERKQYQETIHTIQEEMKCKKIEIENQLIENKKLNKAFNDLTIQYNKLDLDFKRYKKDVVFKSVVQDLNPPSDKKQLSVIAKMGLQAFKNQVVPDNGNFASSSSKNNNKLSIKNLTNLLAQGDMTRVETVNDTIEVPNREDELPPLVIVGNNNNINETTSIGALSKVNKLFASKKANVTKISSIENSNEELENSADGQRRASNLETKASTRNSEVGRSSINIDSITSTKKISQSGFTPNPDVPINININIKPVINAFCVTDGYNPKIVAACTDGNLHTIDIRTGDSVSKLTGHTDRIMCISLCNHIAVTGSRDAFICVWDLNENALMHKLRAHSGAVWCVVTAKHHISNILYAISGGADGKIKAWNAIDGTKLYTLKAHENSILSLDLYTGDHYMVFSGGDDATISIWDMENGVLLKNLQGNTSAVTNIKACAISSDSPILPVAAQMDQLDNYERSGESIIIVSVGRDNVIRVWDSHSGAILFDIHDHSDTINDIKLVPSIAAGLLSKSYTINVHNYVLISCSNDGTCRIFSLETGKEVKYFSAHGGNGVFCMANKISVLCDPSSRNKEEHKEYNIICSYGGDKCIRVKDLDSTLSKGTDACTIM